MPIIERHTKRPVALTVLPLALLTALVAWPEQSAGGARGASVVSIKGDLAGVSATSAGNAWAVGHSCASQCGTFSEVDRTLALRWNGTKWSRITSPDPGGFDLLEGVSASSTSNAWAVGERGPSLTGNRKTLAIHWNGTKWVEFSTPNPSGTFNQLAAVAATSSTNAWAVGTFDRATNSGNVGRTLALHWNGTKWTRVPAPSPDRSPFLLAVDATSASDAWAVGYFIPSTGTVVEKTLILHWDGTKWTQVPSPNPSGVENELLGVSAISAGNAWAVGDFGPNNKPKILVLHWNGTKWTQVPAPTPGAGGHAEAVSATSTGNAWTVGFFFTSTALKNLALRWNGTKWFQVSTPNPTVSTSLAGVSATSVGNAWAVGGFCVSGGCGAPGEVDTTLILHWNGSTWSRQ